MIPLKLGEGRDVSTLGRGQMIFVSALVGTTENQKRRIDMKCPLCTTTDLLMSDRQGIEIDYCPQCRGVWLDRGELDKIIERSSPAAVQQPPPVSGPRHGEADYSSSRMKHGHDDHHYDSQHGHGSSYKKKSLLKELFDF
jgi:hypothetical protein